MSMVYIRVIAGAEHYAISVDHVLEIAEFGEVAHPLRRREIGSAAWLLPTHFARTPPPASTTRWRASCCC